MAGCGSQSGCNHVLSSRWAYWLDIPVSLLALVAYACLLILSRTAVNANPWISQELSWRLLDAFSGLVIAAAGWFAFLQYYVLGEWCKFCLATHTSTVLAATLLIISGADARNEAATLKGAVSCWNRCKTILMAGGLGLAVLITGQLVVKKPSYALSAIGQQSDGLNAGTLRLFDGRFKLNPRELPVYGSPDATNIIVSLFDYTCIHCRRLHPLLKEAVAHYGGQLCIISLPAPLDSECNPLLRTTAHANLHACDYARLSLAVWRARPTAFAEFDEWLFTSLSLPPLDEARQRAEGLVGKDALKEALGSSWVSRQMDTDIDLYASSSRSARDLRLPQLILGKVTLRGAVDSLDDLLALIERHTALQPVPR